MSEIFPTQARGLCTSLATIANWMALFIVTKTYNIMQTSMTIQERIGSLENAPFLVFVFVYMAMPETIGKTLKEIEAIFSKRLNDLPQ